MPKEKFYAPTAVEGDGSNPALEVAWGLDVPGIEFNGARFDRSAVNRLIRTLRKARDQTYGSDE